MPDLLTPQPGAPIDTPADVMPTPAPAPAAPMPDAIPEFFKLDPASPLAEQSAYALALQLKTPPADFDDLLPGTTKTKREIAQENYNSYYEHRKNKGLPVFPTEQAKAREPFQQEMKKAFAGMDKLKENIGEENWRILEESSKGHPNPEAFKARTINNAFLEGVLGQPIPPESFNDVRNAYAAQQLKAEGPVDDLGFYQKLQQKFTEDDTTSAALSAKLQEVTARSYSTVGSRGPGVINPEPGSTQNRPSLYQPPTIQEREDFLKTLPEDKREVAREQWNEQTRETARLFRKHAPLVAEFTSTVEAVKASKDPEKEIWYKIDAMARQLPEHPRDRAAVLAMLSNVLENNAFVDRGALARFTMAAARGVNTAGSSIEQAFQAQVRQTQRAAFGQTPENVSQMPGGFLEGSTPATEIPGFSDADKEFITRKRELLGVIQGSGMKVVSGSDPILAQMAIQAAPSAWMFPAAFHPVGQMAIAESMAGDSMQGARIAQPNVPEGLQTNFATASGIAQGFIETFTNTRGVKIMTGKLPTFTGFLNKFGVQSAGGRAALGFGAGYTATTGMEYTEEMLQGATDLGMQALATDLAGLDPEVDYGKYFKEWATIAGEEQQATLMAVMGFGMVAGAGASFNHFKYGAALARNKTILKAQGLTDAEVNEITNTTNLDEASDRFREAFKEAQKREPNLTPEERSALEQERKNAVEILKARNEAAQAAGVPIVKADYNDFTEKTTYLFTDPIAGTQSRHETEEDAFIAWRDWGRTQEQDQLDTMREASESDFIANITAEGQRAENVDVSQTAEVLTLPKVQQQAEADLQAATKDQAKADTPAQRRNAQERMQSAQGTLAALKARLEVLLFDEAMPASKAAEVFKSTVVRARNYSRSVMGRIAGYTLEIYGGATIQDIAEDFAEVNMKQAVDEGLADPEIILDNIRRYEAMSGARIIDPAYQYDPANTVPLIEGFSKLARGVVMSEINSGLLPETVAKWIQVQLALDVASVELARDLATAAEFRESLQAGFVPPRLKQQLYDAVGLDPQAQQRRLEKKHEDQMAAEALQGFPEIREQAAGKIPHPDTLRANGHPLAGEVRRLWETLRKPTKRRDKNGRAIYRTNEANDYFLPVGQMEDLDDVMQNLNEKGFGFETITDMIDALDASIAYNKPFYGTMSVSDETYAMSIGHLDSLRSELANLEKQSKADPLDSPSRNHIIQAGLFESVLDSARSGTSPSLKSSDYPAGQGSTYTEWKDEAGDAYKFRITDHDRQLSSITNHQRPDFTITASNANVSESNGDWIDALEWLQSRASNFKAPEQIQKVIDQRNRIASLKNQIASVERAEKATAPDYIALGKSTPEGAEIHKQAIDIANDLQESMGTGKYSSDERKKLNKRKAALFSKVEEIGKKVSPARAAEAADMQSRETASGISKAGQSIQANASDSFDFKADMKAQAEWLLDAALERGYQSLDEFVEKDIEGFNQLGRDWRTAHPRGTGGTSQAGTGASKGTGEKGSQVSFALSTPGVMRLEQAIARKMTQGPEERAEYFSRLRDRLAATVLQLRESKRSTATDMTEAERERNRIQDALAEAHAVIKALPIEARGRVTFNPAEVMDATTERGQIAALLRLIDKADEALEDVLVKQYREAFETILDLAKPDLRPNKSIRGRLTPDTQRMVARVLEVTTLEPVELQAALIAKQAEIDNLESQPTPESREDQEKLGKAIVQLHVDQTILETFGNYSRLSASEMAHAYEQLQSIYIQGRTIRRTLDEARQNEMKAARAEVLSSLPPVDQAKHATKTADQGIADQAKAWLMGFSSFHQVMERLFPNSTTARDMQERVRAADRGFTRARIEARERFDNFTFGVWNLTGIGRSRKRNQIIAEMSKRRIDWNVSIREGITFATEKLTEEQAAAILAGTMKTGWETDVIAMTSLNQALVDFRMMRLKAQNEERAFRSNVIQFQRLKGRGQDGPLVMSDMEALYVLQLYAQEQYRPALDKYGFTQQVIERMEKKISSKAHDLGDFLRGEYDAEWNRLNPVYKTLYGLDMPKIRNYAPGMFEHMQGGSAETPQLDGFGQASQVNSMTAGFTKARTHHMAQPKQVNAMAAYWSHLEATEYFIAYAEVSRDMRQIFGTPDVRRALEGNYGIAARHIFSQWMSALEVDGNFKAETMIKMSEATNAFLATQSAVGLAFNMGVLMKQAWAAFGFMLEMPHKDAAKAIARVMAKPSTLRHVWSQEAVQQRVLQGIGPEDRKLLDAAKASPSIIMELLEIGRMPIAYADAAFTTISASVAYQHSLLLAEKAGMAPEAAEAAALHHAARVIERTAQPATAQDKSMAELTAKDFSRVLFMFKSDPRQKLAIVGNALQDVIEGKPGAKSKFARKALWGWVLYGLANEVLSDIWASISRDDDDEDRWDWRDYVAAMIAGPSSSFPLYGQLFEFTVRATVGTRAYVNSYNPIDQASHMKKWGNVWKDLPTTAEELKDFNANDWLTMAQRAASGTAMVAGLFDPRAAILPAGIRAIRDVQGLGANLIDALSPQTEQEARLEIIRDIRAESDPIKEEKAEERKELAKELRKLPADQRAKRIDQLDRDTAMAVIRQLKSAEMTEDERALSRLSKDDRSKAVEKITKDMDPAEQDAFYSRLKKVGIIR